MLNKVLNIEVLFFLIRYIVVNNSLVNVFLEKLNLVTKNNVDKTKTKIIKIMVNIFKIDLLI